MTSTPTWPRPVDPPAAIRLPAPPVDAVRGSFPILATVAPVIASMALWALTQSPFALLFALLGPIVAVASLGDNSRQGRRRRRRELARFEEEAIEVEQLIGKRHADERLALEAEFPAVGELIDERGIEDAWRAPGTAVVRVGTGDAPSPLRLESAGIRHTDGRVRDRLLELESSAGRVPSGAVLADAGAGIGYCGAPVTRHAAARAAVIRLARALDPSVWTVRASVADGNVCGWGWLEDLPHRVEASVHGARADRIEFGQFESLRPGSVESPVARICIAVSADRLPRDCATVVSVDGGSATVTETIGTVRQVRPEFVSAEQAHVAATALAARARRTGLVDRGRELVDGVSLADLANPPSPSSPGLGCEVGVAPGGAWSIDLVADGPHAVVGGVTGSGKSELLTSWLLAMAARYTPDDVTFLLVDFKGGATFGAISLLPHSVGLITDLDRGRAGRALESLRAELAFRERAIAAADARSIDELTGRGVLARLVIVVDEFAALSEGSPELRDLFSDLAARGRSLGIHLILCTQRPAATLREAILANCTLRICLRVNDPADSVALLGTAAAAGLPRVPVGRALVSTGDAPATLVQVAVAALDDAAAVALTASGRHPVRRPWCDPLPDLIDLGALPPSSDGAAIAFGMLDLPQSQRQTAAEWRPRSHGSLLVLGGFGSGKSAALRAIGERAGSASSIPSDVEGAWDGVIDAVESIDSPRTSTRVVLIDDLDALIARLPTEYQGDFADAVLRLLRDGPARDVFTVLSVRSVPSSLAVVASACDGRLLLRMPDRSEHVMAGGRGADFDERMPPGGGFFRGDRVQVGWTPPRVSPPAAPVELGFPPGETTAVISAAPRDFIAAVGGGPASAPHRVIEIDGAAAASREIAVADPGGHLLIVGDPDRWQAAWSRMPVIRSRARLVFHRASVLDYRTITRSRRLPPALSGDPTHVWVVDGEGPVRRAALPRRP